MTSRFVLRGGTVLALGPRASNRPRADVLIDGDRIAEIGLDVRARDAEEVDATDAIVMPGFVDAHRHAWRSLFRNVGETALEIDAVQHYTNDDVYAATLVGLLGAVEAGVTTVADWSEARLDDGSAEAVLQAHADAGVRTVFVDGGRADGGPVRERVERLSGLAGPSTTVAFGVADVAPDDDWRGARDAGRRIHVHTGPATSVRGAVASLAERGLLAGDVTLVHPRGLGATDADAVRSTGASITLAPSSEMAGGLGAPAIQPLIDREIRPALGIDDERIAPGDVFAQMRETISLQHATVFDLKLAGKAGLPKLMTTRDVIRYATVDGARALGLAGVTGSLEPGLQADVIVLRTDRPNVFPINDPIGAVVWGMDTSNVDWVFAAGRVLMRAGVLEADVTRARGLAAAARDRVAAAAGLVVAAVPEGRP